MDNRTRALQMVHTERERQECLRSQGKFPWTLAETFPDPSEKFVVLAEEVGELARALQEGDSLAILDEVTHVAACAVAWVESYCRAYNGHSVCEVPDEVSVRACHHDFIATGSHSPRNSIVCRWCGLSPAEAANR